MAAPLKPKDAPDLSRFGWEDPFRLNDQMSEDERMMRDSARAYAQERLQPRVIAAYREEKTDPAIFREMGEMGLLGVTIPEEYGGLGASYVSYGLVAREVERVDSGYRSTARAMASAGASSARPSSAITPRVSTALTASSSTARWRRPNCSS